MPQPHITHETYKGLTPDEQDMYPEEIWEEKLKSKDRFKRVSEFNYFIYKTYENFERMSLKCGIETRCRHYFRR